MCEGGEDWYHPFEYLDDISLIQINVFQFLHILINLEAEVTFSIFRCDLFQWLNLLPVRKKVKFWQVKVSYTLMNTQPV